MSTGSTRPGLVFTHIILAAGLAIGYFASHEMQPELSGWAYHLTLWPGLSIIALQAMATVLPLFKLTRPDATELNEAAVEFPYSLCIALGILGTFTGFSMIFHEFSMPGESGGGTPPFTPQTYASIKLAFYTSITGISLASFFDFAVSRIREDVRLRANRREDAMQFDARQAANRKKIARQLADDGVPDGFLGRFIWLWTRTNGKQARIDEGLRLYDQCIKDAVAHEAEINARRDKATDDPNDTDGSR